MKMKMEIYNALLLQSTVKNIELEKSFGDVRADIFCEINGVAVAIEVQKSNLSIEDLNRRTIAYSQKNIYVLWAGLIDDRLYQERFIPKAWEIWLYMAYGNEVYYWEKGCKLISFAFEKCYTYIPLTDFGGGYDKELKRYKAPKYQAEFEIFNCIPKEISAKYERKNPITIPSCKLFIRNNKY